MSSGEDKKKEDGVHVLWVIPLMDFIIISTGGFLRKGANGMVNAAIKPE